MLVLNSLHSRQYHRRCGELPRTVLPCGGLSQRGQKAQSQTAILLSPRSVQRDAKQIDSASRLVALDGAFPSHADTRGAEVSKWVFRASREHLPPVRARSGPDPVCLLGRFSYSRSALRQRCGVSPTYRLNVVVKWACVWKPTPKATSTIEFRASDSRTWARRIRCIITNWRGDMPT